MFAKPARISRHVSIKRATHRTSRPKLALNVLGSGKGGFRTQRGELLDGLIRGLVSVAHDEDVDVLVCFGHVMYSAAQSARKELTEKNEEFDQVGDFPLTQKPKVFDLRKWRKQENLLCSSALAFPSEPGCLIGRGYLSLLQTELLKMAQRHFEVLTRDAMTVIRHYAEKQNKSAELEERMQSLLAGVRSGSANPLSSYGYEHALLASLPTNEYITTNFDSLFEAACDHRQPKLSVIPQSASKFAQDPNGF